MELTLTERMKVEKAKLQAENDEKERIFKENHAKEREEMFRLLPDITGMFEAVSTDQYKFDIGVYDYSKVYHHEHYAIVVKYLKWGKYGSCFEQVCIRPVEGERFIVSNNYITHKETITANELIERVMKFASRGTMENTLYEHR